MQLRLHHHGWGCTNVGCGGGYGVKKCIHHGLLNHTIKIWWDLHGKYVWSNQVNTRDHGGLMKSFGSKYKV